MIEELFGEGLIKALFKFLLTAVQFILRAMFYLAVEIGIEIIGRWVGWTTLRICTFGRFPPDEPDFVRDEAEEHVDGRQILLGLFGIGVLLGLVTLVGVLLSLF